MSRLNFVKLQSISEKVDFTKDSISTIALIHSTAHRQCGNLKNSHSPKNISSNRFFSNLSHNSVEKYYKTRSQFLRKNQHFFPVKSTIFTRELISLNFLCGIFSTLHSEEIAETLSHTIFVKISWKKYSIFTQKFSSKQNGEKVISNFNNS